MYGKVRKLINKIIIIFFSGVILAVQPNVVTTEPITEHIYMEVEENKIIPNIQIPHTIYSTNEDPVKYIIKSPGTMYLSAQKVGSTDLIFLDDNSNTLITYNIIVTHPITAIKKLLTSTLKQQSQKLQLKTVGKNLIISGSYPNKNAETKVLKLIGRLIPAGDIINIANHEHNISTEQINLKIKVVEMNRVVKKALGLNFGLNFSTNSQLSFNSPVLGMPSPASNGSLGSFLIGTETTAGLFIGNFSLRSLLNIMSEEQLITYLAEPNLLLMPDQPGRFLFGGEVPIQNAAALGGTNDVTYKEYGIQIAATATILADNTIRIKLSPSISKLSDNHSLYGTNNNNNQQSIAPAFLVRNIETTVELKSGQSIAIAGLIESESSQNEAHIPGLENVPLLKDLTRQESNERNEKEIVLIVTPYLIQAAGNQDLTHPNNPKAIVTTIKAKPGFIIG